MNDDSVGVAVVGGYSYTNGSIPAIQGKFVCGDYRLPGADDGPTGRLMAATPTDEGQWPLEELRIENTDSGRLPGSILTLGRDNKNRLYVLTTAKPAEGGTGAVHRIVPPESSNQASANTSMATTPGAETVVGTDSGGSEGTTTDMATGTTATRTSAESESTSTPTAGTNASDSGTTASAGPGFGVVAGIAGFVALAARRLLGDD